MTKAKTTNPRNSNAFRNAPLEERFHKSYFVTPSGCWEWCGFVAQTGYGIISNNSRRLLAHRVSYQLHHKDPGNLCVLHRCDYRKCVNPDHLFLGTRSDNNFDKEMKGRGQFGERHYSAKLKETDIPIIIRRYQEGTSYIELAKEYALNCGTIYQIVNKQTWKHLHKG